jgi:hypothetical protein
MAPSPTIAITGRPGCANLAAIAYGTPLPMPASLPDAALFGVSGVHDESEY